MLHEALEQPEILLISIGREIERARHFHDRLLLDAALIFLLSS